jgi:hypothetical protein
VRGDTHAGCGERSGETGPWQHRHRAPDRLNIVRGASLVVRSAFDQWACLRQLLDLSIAPFGEVIAGSSG